MPSSSHGRTSFWIRTFAEARQRTEWTLVARQYTRATAAQIASDINSAHRRAPDRRMRGVLEAERWQAFWEPAPTGPLGDFVIWIRPVR